MFKKLYDCQYIDNESETPYLLLFKKKKLILATIFGTCHFYGYILTELA